MTRARTLAEIYSGEQNPRGEISRALLSHDAALRRIVAKCREAPDSHIVGYVLEVAEQALGERSE